MKHNKLLLTISILLSAAVFMVNVCFSTEIPINPITPSIKDKIKQTADSIKTLEDDLGPKVKELEKTYTTYKQTCKDKQNDRGCIEMENQITQKYKEVLESLNTKIPKLKNELKNSAQELGMSIIRKTRTKDIKEIYEHISGKSKLPKIRGPLSRKLNEILKLVGVNKGNISLLELSLMTQADMISAIEILDYLEANIQRQIILIEMGQQFADLSPEMVQIMRGVSELIGFNNTEFDFEIEEDEEISSPDDWRK